MKVRAVGAAYKGRVTEGGQAGEGGRGGHTSPPQPHTSAAAIQKGLIDVTRGKSSQKSSQFHVSIFINLLRFRKSVKKMVSSVPFGGTMLNTLYKYFLSCKL